MSAARLREAAALMRERATAASPGPWEHHGDDVWTSDDIFAVTASWDVVDDAQHIASWHPAVALAVADWLDKIADEGHEGDGPEGCADPAVDVANAYLGSDS